MTACQNYIQTFSQSEVIPEKAILIETNIAQVYSSNHSSSQNICILMSDDTTISTTSTLRPFVPDNPGELVPEG